MQVYFLGCAQHGLIKIGLSNLPHDRLRGMAMWSPVPLTLLAHAEVERRRIESHLHFRFRHLWSHFEWFREAPELDALVTYVRTFGALPPAVIAWETPTGWRLPHQRARGPRDKSPEARRAQTANAVKAKIAYAARRRAAQVPA